jgi:hypothetical protein
VGPGRREAHVTPPAEKELLVDLQLFQPPLVVRFAWARKKKGTVTKEARGARVAYLRPVRRRPASRAPRLTKWTRPGVGQKSVLGVPGAERKRPAVRGKPAEAQVPEEREDQSGHRNEAPRGKHKVARLGARLGVQVERARGMEGEWMITSNFMNENCLQGMRCPKCGSVGPFRLKMMAVVLTFDDGTDDYEDTEWLEDGFAACVDCDWEGKVCDLRDEVPVRALTEGHVYEGEEVFGELISLQLCFSLREPQDEEDEAMASLVELCENCSHWYGEGSMVYHPKEGVDFEDAAETVRKGIGM